MMKNGPHGEDYLDDTRIRRLGIGVLVVVFVVFGGWAAFAPLASAVVSSGVVTVENYRKTVQHLEGGIVKSLAVGENDQVEKGQVLLLLDDTQSRAQLEVLKGQLIISLAREARLNSQKSSEAKVRFPEALMKEQSDERVKDAMAVQSQVFSVRRSAYMGEIDLYRRQIGQLQAKLRGLKAQKAGRDRMVESYAKEVRDFNSLLKEGYVEAQRVREYERNLAQSEGQQGELLANVAAAELQISETELKILQLQKDMQREVAKELSEVQNDLFSLREKIQSLEETVRRTSITAPDAGRVLGLSVHTPGAVVPPGGRLMEIVPQGEGLILETQISPADIDRVRVGQSAEIRFTAFKSRDLPAIYGKVISVSADRLMDESNKANPQPYFLARVAVTPEGINTLASHHFALRPGMPAEVMVNTGERTLLQYLIRPLRDSFARGMRED